MAENDKKTRLSIVIRTVDQATAKIKAINEQLDKATKPVRDFKKALSDLREKSGLDDVVAGFKGVGSAVAGLLEKVGVIGGVLGGMAGAAVAELLSISKGFDDLGKRAAQLGVGVDFLAQMRYAAERTGVPVEELDDGLRHFSENLGQARANTGRMAKFIGRISPVLLKQLKAAKGNAEAFDLLANAIAKIHDPAKRAALAQKTLGDSGSRLAPMLAQGGKGLKALRDRYLAIAGSQVTAAAAGAQVNTTMIDLHAATDSVKGALLEGLAPALTKIIQQLQAWLTGHRADIAAWAAQIGEKLPGAVRKLWAILQKVVDKVEAFVTAVGGLKNVAIAAAAVVAGPLILSVTKLAAALFTALSRAGQLGKALSGLPKEPAEEGLASGGGTSGRRRGRVRAPGISGIPGALAAAAMGGLSHDDANFIRARLAEHDAAVAARGVSSDFGKGSILLGSLYDLLHRKDFAAAERAGSTFGPLFDMVDRADLSAQARSALGAGRAPSVGAGPGGNPAAQQQQTTIRVQFDNAPRGTRVKTAPGSTADVDLSVGYQLLDAMGFGS